jgi:hypothetical protein
MLPKSKDKVPGFPRSNPQEMGQAPDCFASWKTYFNVERVLSISNQFNQLMNGWVIDGTATKLAFDDFYRRKMKKTYYPALCSVTMPIKRKIEPGVQRKDRKKKKKDKRLPPREVIPAPKRRKDFEANTFVEPPKDSLERNPDICLSAEDSPYIVPSSQTDALDVYEPVLIIFGRPSTQLHYIKLSRFSQNLKGQGRKLPFLLRNIVVEELEDQ